MFYDDTCDIDGSGTGRDIPFPQVINTAMTTYNTELLQEIQEFLQREKEKIKPDKSAPKKQSEVFLWSNNHGAIFPVPKNNFDEVYPKLVLGDSSIARDKEVLKSMGITHIVNMCMGSKFNMIDTSREYFKDANITFIGFPAKDIMVYNLSQHFEPAVEFIEQALAENGKIYVHCQAGMSRSATVVLAFLMIKRGMTLMEAVQAVRPKRAIFPNDGFLKQLCELNKRLYEK